MIKELIQGGKTFNSPKHLFDHCNETELRMYLSLTRQYVLEVWRDAQIRYQDDSSGKPKLACIGVGRFVYDVYGYTKKKQPVMFPLTEWKPFDKPSDELKTECELWADAYFFARQTLARAGKPVPAYDFHFTQMLEGARLEAEYKAWRESPLACNSWVAPPKV